MIKVGLVGAGGIGTYHARAYAQIPGARLVAVADIRPEAADKLAWEYGARAYCTLDAFLGDKEVEMVDVCVPTYAHEEAVVAAAQAGKHILCEKPIALELGQVDRMIEAVEKAGVKAMVAQVCRFMSHYQIIKDYYDRGELGRPVMATAARLAALPKWATWYWDPQKSGGAILDLLIHDLDYLYSLFGRPKAIYAVGFASENGGWNQALAVLDYGRHKAAAEATFLMPKGFPFTMTFRLLGDKGCAQYPYRVREPVDPRAAALGQADLAIYLGGESPICPEMPDRDPYLAEIEYFVNCLMRGEAPKIATLYEARDVLEIALAVRRSLETGQVIPF